MQLDCDLSRFQIARSLYNSVYFIIESFQIASNRCKLFSLGDYPDNRAATYESGIEMRMRLPSWTL